jgi:hypothetical protein
MTSYHYLDTCALVGWCCADVSPVNDIDQACADTVDSLLSDANASVAISELTLVEVHDTLAKLWRVSDAPQFDEAWVIRSMRKIFGAIEADTLGVASVPPKAAEHAILLVTLATRDHGLKFKAWDATHLITATNWAHEVGSPVAIVTADSDFRRFLDAHGYFSKFVSLTLVTV